MCGVESRTRCGVRDVVAFEHRRWYAFLSVVSRQANPAYLAHRRSE
jgi:hypothetical protein